MNKDEERIERQIRSIREHRINFTERELALIKNCRIYADNEPAELSNHDLMIIIAKYATAMENSN